MPISDAVIQSIARASFDVYMRDRKDTFLIFTDGTRIGYLQNSAFRGISVSTVHVPNKSSGTGFGILDSLSEADLTAEKLNEAFVIAPDWARDRQSVRKWKDLVQFQASNNFNAEYKMIAPRAA